MAVIYTHIKKVISNHWSYMTYSRAFEEFEKPFIRGRPTRFSKPSRSFGIKASGISDISNFLGRFLSEKITGIRVYDSALCFLDSSKGFANAANLAATDCCRMIAPTASDKAEHIRHLRIVQTPPEVRHGERGRRTMC
jgi:hypothetical protein